MLDVDAPVGYLGHRGVGYLIGHLAAAVVARHHGQGKRQVTVGLLAYLGHREYGLGVAADVENARLVFEEIVFGFTAREGNEIGAGLCGLRYLAGDLGQLGEGTLIVAVDKAHTGIGELGHLVALAALLVVGRQREGGFCHHERHALLGGRVAVGAGLFHS